AGLAGGLTGDSSADAVAGAQAGKNAVENNALGLALKGCGIAAPCRSLIAKQVLEFGVKAGITGIVAKEIADKISEDDLDHLVTLKMMGNDEITEKYLNSLQDKYAPAHTGGDQNAGSGPTDTGGNQIADNSPDHTGNDQSTGQGATNTGNTDGKPDAGGSSTVTPIPEGANKDDLAYLALKGKEAQEAAKNLGFDRRISPQKAPFNSHGQPVYFDGKNYITPDIDSHNVTNGWKMFDRKGDRIGTYDSNLNRIKD
ncbi:VENN motif pre-toxin domain-containing protein, partial [Yersinia pseudotuberculosis]